MQNLLYLLCDNINTISSLESLKFNSVIQNIGDITYNSSTGIITLNSVGIYHLQWWVATKSSISCELSFAVQSSQGDNIGGNSPLRTGLVSGIAVINVTSAPVTVSLNNISTKTICL